MKRFIFVLLIMLASQAVGAQGREPIAQLNLHNQNALLKAGGGDSLVARFSAEWWAAFKGPIGGWGYAYAEKNYFETVHGLYLTLPLGFEVGAAAGVENFYSAGSWLKADSARFRYALIAGLGDVDDLGIEVYAENGSSRDEEGRSQPWARIFANWQVQDGFLALGVLGQMTRHAETTDGLGPRVGITLPNLPLEVWGMVSVLPGGSRGNVLFGGRLSLTKYTK